MTCLGRNFRGNYVKTACGVLLDKRALALAKTKGKVAFLNVDEAGTYNWVISAVKSICPKCLAQSKHVGTLSVNMLLRLKIVHDIHIDLEADSGSVTMCCGKRWDMQSLFRNGVGFIPVHQLLAYMVDENSPNEKLCDECLQHAKVQMRLLAAVEL